MIAKEVTFNLSLVLLFVAVVLFVLAAIPKLARAWMIAIGLACFAGAFLVDRLWP
jgi:flagellar biosynthesis component FlhA